MLLLPSSHQPTAKVHHCTCTKVPKHDPTLLKFRARYFE
uniref:Uncharacterized protein n=1 Tax=Arundo donax TaxID=35708 RepID=A0A0A9GYL0_ARUDO